MKLDLGAVSPDGKQRTVTADLPADARQGSGIRSARYGESIRQGAGDLDLALMFAVRECASWTRKLRCPMDLEVSPRAGELPAGVVPSALAFMFKMHRRRPSCGCLARTAKALAVDGAARRADSCRETASYQRRHAVPFLRSRQLAHRMRNTLTATLENPGEEASAPHRLGRVMGVPRIDSLRLTDEAAGDGNYVGILTGRDLEGISKAGWHGHHGTAVATLPTAIAEQPNKQSLRIELPWPSPAPHSPIYVWLAAIKPARRDGQILGREHTAALLLIAGEMHPFAIHCCGFLAWIDGKPAIRTSFQLDSSALNVTHMDLDSPARALFQFRRE